MSSADGSQVYVQSVGGHLGNTSRLVALGALSGFVAGIVAGGIGSRVVMRIVAVTAGSAAEGTLTDAEAVVGNITAEGTIGLVLFGGGMLGTAGGLMYVAVRRWICDAGGLQGLVYGILLLAMFGWAIIEGDNQDFSRLGDPLLNVLLFAALFILYGLVLVWVFRTSDRTLPPINLSLSGMGSLAVLGFGLVLAAGIIAGVLEGFGESGAARIFLTALPMYMMLALPLASVLITRSRVRFERLSDLKTHPWVFGGALALIEMPIIVGMVLDANAILEIFGPQLPPGHPR